MRHIIINLTLVSILALLSFFAQLSCGRMYDITKEEFIKQYNNNKKTPSILVTTFNSFLYNIPYDSYYLKSDTIYYGVNVEDVQVGKHPDEHKIAIRDVQSIKVSQTDLLLGPFIFLIGALVFIGIFYLGIALGGGPDI